MLVKWPELTMTLDRQGAVAVCEVGCQQSFDWSEDDEMCKCMDEMAGNVHELAKDFGESEIQGEARRGQRKVKEEIPRLTFWTRDGIGEM